MNPPRSGAVWESPFLAKLGFEPAHNQIDKPPACLAFLQSRPLVIFTAKSLGTPDGAQRGDSAGVEAPDVLEVTPMLRPQRRGACSFHRIRAR